MSNDIFSRACKKFGWFFPDTDESVASYLRGCELGEILYKIYRNHRDRGISVVESYLSCALYLMASSVKVSREQENQKE